MANEILHSTISAAADDGDPTHIQGGDWNAGHLVNAAGLTALLNVFATTLKGLVPASGSTATYLKGDGTWSTAAQLTAFLSAFTSSLQGVVPASGGGTTNFLRADGSWAAPVPSGRLLGKQILTGSGSGTLATGTCVVHLRGIGQGGGGGGGSGAGSTGFGAGGSSGALLDIWIGTPGAALGTLSISWTAGSAGGAGGANTGGNGAAGSDSTITINSVTYTMKGGGGGAGMPAPGSTAATVLPTAPASGTTSGGVVTWGFGAAGLVMPSQAAGFAGQGGSSPLGAGGAPRSSAGAGNAGDTTGFGGGGGGGVGGNVGGAGAAGGFILEQYT